MQAHFGATTIANQHPVQPVPLLSHGTATLQVNALLQARNGANLPQEQVVAGVQPHAQDAIPAILGIATHKQLAPLQAENGAAHTALIIAQPAQQHKNIIATQKQNVNQQAESGAAHQRQRQYQQHQQELLHLHPLAGAQNPVQNAKLANPGIAILKTLARQ